MLVVAAWQYTGFMMVLILAGLQGIPKELYEAASIDGARGLKAFWHITLPSIRNVLLVAVLITTIGGFKVFDFVFVLTQGGPANATQVLGTYIYLQAFNLANMGYANAIAVVLLAIAVVLGWLQLKASRRADEPLPPRQPRALRPGLAVEPLRAPAAAVDGVRRVQDAARDLHRSAGPARHAELPEF